MKNTCADCYDSENKKCCPECIRNGDYIDHYRPRTTKEEALEALHFLTLHPVNKKDTDGFVNTLRSYIEGTPK